MWAFKKMKINTTALVLIAVAVVVVIVIVIGAVRFRIQATAQVGRSPSPTDSHSRHSVSAPRAKSEYELVRGPKVETEAPAQTAEASQNQPGFPRYEAAAGKADSLATMQQKIRSHAQFRDLEEPKQEKTVVANPVTQNKTVVSNTLVESIKVASIAELFSPKQDVEAEFGVTEEEVQKMVAQYKASHEFKERALPVSRYFNMENYTESRQVLRESAKNLNKNHASKRGQITNAIYKKYGRSFAAPTKVQNNPDVMSAVVGNAQHRELMAEQKGSRNLGKLEVRR